MKEIIFVLKVFVITFVVVVIMQIRIGDLTVEERASIFIQDSWVTEQIQLVGDGLEKVLAQTTGGLGKKLSSIFKKEEVVERGNFKLERSATYQSTLKKEQEAAVSAVSKELAK